MRLQSRAIVTLVSLIALTLPPSAAGAVDDRPNERPDLRTAIYVDGVLITESIYGRSERTVEAWIRPDGVFRVRTATVRGPGSGGSEDVYGLNDGRQVVVLRYPGGDREEVVLVSNNGHFAIDSGTPSEGFFRQGPNASVEYLVRESMPTNATEAFERLPHLFDIASPEAPTPVSINGPTGSRGAGGNSGYGMNIYTNQPCSYHYNYRNNVTDFFTASTQKQSACRWVRVIMWNWSMGSPCGGIVIGTGPLSTYYSSYATYADTFNGQPHEYMCSNHAAWDSNWILHVPWVSMRAGVAG